MVKVQIYKKQMALLFHHRANVTLVIEIAIPIANESPWQILKRKELDRCTF